VGHEIDVTLADLAADVRALTPSEAAERVVPSVDELSIRLRGFRGRLRASVSRRLALLRTRLDALAEQRTFRRPFELVHDRSRRADELEMRANSLVWRLLADRESSVATLGGKLQSLSPLAVLGRGYSITQDAATGAVVRSADKLRPGQHIVTRFAAGAANSRIESIDRTVDQDSSH
jgi:exodeoxyribonuclease VII large subunit